MTNKQLAKNMYTVLEESIQSWKGEFNGIFRERDGYKCVMCGRKIKERKEGKKWGSL